MNRRLWGFLAVVPVLVWSGMVLGISFMEAPLKFTAPGITVPLGLGIGRIVFHALNWAEVALAVLALASGLLGRVRGGPAWAFGVAAALLVYQMLLLMPVLDARAIRILAGEDVPHSHHHTLYIVAEAAKVLALWVCAVWQGRNITRQ